MADQAVAKRVRAFNRFYTETIGSLAEQHEGLDVTLAESRTLFTVKSLGEPQVNQIAQALGLDLPYTSRLLGILEDKGLIQRAIAQHDRRHRVVTLTPIGERLLEEIEHRSNKRVLGLIEHLDSNEVNQLLAAMETIVALITKQENGHDQPD